MPTHGVDRDRLEKRLDVERGRFAKLHPRSKKLYNEAAQNMLYGVPMPWMVEWPGDFPVYAHRATGARLTDVDGNEYIDFCLGDTGAMTGHSPPGSIPYIQEQMGNGITYMLPSEDALWVSRELSRRFKLPYWQYALTATDANRFAINVCRRLTGRNTILIFNYCYHGTVDLAYLRLQEGEVRPRYGSLAPVLEPGLSTRIVEFNDIPALEAALETQDVACVLAEPALTNIGIVMPEPGFHSALRKVTRDTGTLLVIDETHTISSGPGGYTAAHALEPDLLTLGKPLGSGIPCAAYGFSRRLGEQIIAGGQDAFRDISAVGGTLAGNALSFAAARATLENVLTEEAYTRMIPLAERFARGVQTIIEEFELPWHVTQLGCRAEYWFCATPPRNGAQAAAAFDSKLNDYMHLAALNRGVLITPFHNMALMSPATSEADVNQHTAVFRDSVSRLVGK
jgi:glutamate-1-semialdehyde 2,1-aminomutase